MLQLTVPEKVASRGITTREQFLEWVTDLNQTVKRPDISIVEAKAALTKADVIRAWASFDKHLTIEEKKEANRAMARTILMLSELAEKEQPRTGSRSGKQGSDPGPAAWLRRELKISRSMAQSIRKLGSSPDIYRHVLDEGLHWMTALSSGHGRNKSGLTRAAAFMKYTNSLRLALSVDVRELGRELSRVRRITAWCQAYEHALIQRQAHKPAEKV